MKNYVRVWKKIFSNPRYLLISLVIALLFYALNVFVPNIGALTSFYGFEGFLSTLKFFLVLMLGFWNTITIHSYISLLIVSVLFGVLFSLLIYKVRIVETQKIKKTGILASFGIFIGALAPGCAACGIGLLSLLGLSTVFITFLPFDGLELSILAIALLGISIFSITKGLDECGICKVRLNSNNERGFD